MKKSSAALAAFAVLTAFAGEVSPLLSGFHPDPSVTRGADGAYYLVTSGTSSSRSRSPKA